MLFRSVPPLALCLALLLAGCPGAEKCRVGNDCASGVCLSSGECGVRNYPDADLPIHWPDTGSNGPDAEQATGEDAATVETDGAVVVEADGSVVVGADAGVGEDAATPVPPDASAQLPDGGLQTCTANHDGIITRDELPVVLGAKATFLVAHDISVNTVGTQQPDGTWIWDFSGPLNGDAKVEFSPKAIGGEWFEPDFPGAEFTLRLAGSADTLGVLQGSLDALLLHGMVSPVKSDTATNFFYQKDESTEDPAPVKTIAYPLKTGATWTSSGVINGDYDGQTYHCDAVPPLLTCTPGYPTYACCIRHVYTSTVDKAGKLLTPLGTFDVVRIKNVVEFEALYGTWTNLKTVRSYVFVAECFGTVAAIAAQDGETLEEFTTAAEVRRLSP
ncbi:MAG TPA: hypothetical protein VGK67_20875 [Myxococcales bacterium]|jgi:hypothetical protein